MNPQHIAVMQECAALSLAGEISFGQVVARLSQIGLERYHADYTRNEITYYLPDGQSHVLPISHPPCPIAQTFSLADVQSAIRQIQAGQIQYTQFLHLTSAAGCVGYLVHLTGRQVLYLARTGELHIERFPSPR